MEVETKERRCYVYHIKRKGMGLDDGYVGITFDTDKRFKDHRISEYLVGNKIRAHVDDIEFNTLIISDRKTCSDLERKLRPEPNMGWNLRGGGDNESIRSPESIKAGAEKMTGRTKENHAGVKAGIAKRIKYVKNPTQSMIDGRKIVGDKMRERVKNPTQAMLDGRVSRSKNLSGLKHFNADQNLYNFQHPEHGLVASTRAELIQKYESAKWIKVLFYKKPRKSSGGWTLVKDI